LTPLFAVFAVVITPDSSLILCWSAYLWWLVDLHQRLDGTGGQQSGATSDNLEPSVMSANTMAGGGEYTEGRTRITPVSNQVPMTWWLLGGVILGCGVLSKYTMGLAVPTGFISLLIVYRRWKQWLPGYILHGIIAFAVASPILIYNIGQHFEPLLFQLHHVAEKTPSSLRSFGDFVGVQILSFGPLPFTLLPWVLYKLPASCRNPRLRVCVCLYALPLAFFLYKSTQSRLEANWPIVCFISFWPLVSEWYATVRQSKAWRWATAAAFLVPATAVLGLFAHLIHPISLVPIPADRIYRQIAVNGASHELANLMKERGETLPVYTDTYQSTAQLRFQSLDARQIADLTRHSHFTRPPRRLTDVDRAYVVMSGTLPDAFSSGFPPPTLIGSVDVKYRGQTDKTLNVWLYSKDEHEAKALESK
jgi:hypothetical protein